MPTPSNEASPRADRRLVSPKPPLQEGVSGPATADRGKDLTCSRETPAFSEARTVPVAPPAPERRSIFPNYTAAARAPTAPAPANSATPGGAPQSADAPQPLQQAIDAALARSFFYRLLAKAFEYPSQESWDWLQSPDTRAAAASCATALGTHNAPRSDTPATGSASSPGAAASPHQTLSALDIALAAWLHALSAGAFEHFESDYAVAFGHAARGQCPINEIDYGDLNADPLFQPHRLADLGAFYRAFGVELAADADERPDHLCVELEFMSVLAAKDAHALEHQVDAELAALGRTAQRHFVRNHLAYWTPAFCRRLAQTLPDDSFLAACGNLARVLIAADCARLDVEPGSEDLRLRPVDPDADFLCASCSISEST